MRIKALLPSAGYNCISILLKNIVRFSQTSVNLQQTTWSQILDDSNFTVTFMVTALRISNLSRQIVSYVQ
jgi:hypothetical protein